jgi:hypothetical protein
VLCLRVLRRDQTQYVLRAHTAAGKRLLSPRAALQQHKLLRRPRRTDTGDSDAAVSDGAVSARHAATTTTSDSSLLSPPSSPLTAAASRHLRSRSLLEPCAASFATDTVPKRCVPASVDIPNRSET